MLAAKEQIVLTGSVLDETVALRLRERRAALLPAIRAHIASQRMIVDSWLAGEPRLQWAPPPGGVVAFPRIRVPVDTSQFYARLAAAGVHVGPGHWFEQAPHHFRIGWGWPTATELRFGLREISTAIDLSPGAPA